ncbi:CDP-diacylglycerol--glycerol-3-phosphate 3-phosphatidyltransferase [Agrococcus casei]|uniref:CDP-diacylglycerol--glycerol-3-phosphate 3-phosphatidyltransferase n=1 Tax=Agrococcus casei TaxID=343512 RepID=UPI003F8EC965
MSILGPWRGRVWAKGESPASVASVPNLISVFRILLTPVFVIVLLADDGRLGAERIIAAVLFVVLIATDFVDGQIARRRNLVTDFGKLIDPIADKIITGAGFVMLSVLGELPWIVTIIILLREWGITLHRLIVSERTVIAAAWSGKAKTFAQAIAVPLALMPLWLWLGDWVHAVNTIAMTAALLLTLWSGIDYVWQAVRQRGGAVDAPSTVEPKHRSTE